MANSKRTLQERIQLLIDGRLDDAERRDLEQELANDPAGRMSSHRVVISCTVDMYDMRIRIRP